MIPISIQAEVFADYAKQNRLRELAEALAQAMKPPSPLVIPKHTQDFFDSQQRMYDRKHEAERAAWRKARGL